MRNFLAGFTACAAIALLFGWLLFTSGIVVVRQDDHNISARRALHWNEGVFVIGQDPHLKFDIPWCDFESGDGYVRTYRNYNEAKAMREKVAKFMRENR